MRPSIKLRGGLSAAIFLLAAGGEAQRNRVVDLIDPLIGTINGGPYLTEHSFLSSVDVKDVAANKLTRY